MFHSGGVDRHQVEQPLPVLCVLWPVHFQGGCVCQALSKIDDLCTETGGINKCTTEHKINFSDPKGASLITAYSEQIRDGAADLILGLHGRLTFDLSCEVNLRWLDLSGQKTGHNLSHGRFVCINRL